MLSSLLIRNCSLPTQTHLVKHHLILLVNWNPSYDEQAQDRAYRIGQDRDVEVLRLVARGTIEEQMYARQVYKVQLKKQTLGGNVDGKNQPQMFKGVDKDEHRKGELFGLENLLKFRDGSFMELLVSLFLLLNA
jgi:hypothetical protein